MEWAGSGFRKLVTFEFRFNGMMRYRQRGERAYILRQGKDRCRGLRSSRCWSIWSIAFTEATVLEK